MSLSKRREIFDAAENGDYETVESGLSNGIVSPVAVWDWTMGGKYFGRTLRQVAEAANQTEIVELIDSYLAAS